MTLGGDNIFGEVFTDKGAGEIYPCGKEIRIGDMFPCVDHGSPGTYVEVDGVIDFGPHHIDDVEG